MTDKTHISSLLVTAKPELIPNVVSDISNMPIAEAAHSDAVGKIIVTLETPDESAIVQALTDIQLLDGVVSAGLVYHHAEALADAAEI
ncbi:assembly protein for periplasmic nitrate reductase [Roseovarius albus]|uniref:Chaperone NapD n=1 Tax=Roseovarius albus TaxID=1247867 RepID=A0A1X6Y740_9RHOB|nr:chaperone NapD [Roseovarius albus]SLN12648.1 assembly protein for periplasmic nitrate reductase [Roseovarius albus]